jgi:D-glycero-D-manno-heptose 1,7-bisphosphate phosphatase
MTEARGQPAVFLDRDGTLNEEKRYLCDPEKLVLIPDIERALRRLADGGYLLFIVTNQSGIGRGYYTEADMHRVNARLIEMLAPAGVRFHEIYFSPEHPEAESRGRKPSPAFLQDAARDHHVDLRRSYMIGDKYIDLACGWNAGVRRSILVRTGYGAEMEQQHAGELRDAWVVDDLSAAADRILAADPAP